MSAKVIQFDGAQKRFELAFDAYELAGHCICAINHVTSADTVDVLTKYREIVQKEFPRLFQDRLKRDVTDEDREKMWSRMGELEGKILLLVTDFVEREVADLYASAGQTTGLAHRA